MSTVKILAGHRFSKEVSDQSYWNRGVTPSKGGYQQKLVVRTLIKGQFPKFCEVFVNR